MKDKTNKDEEIKMESNHEAQSDNEVTKECSCEGHESTKTECVECEEYKTKYLRAIADYQNYERRVHDQRIEWTKNANKNLILKLLSFLDDLERAEIFIKDSNLMHVKESFVKMLKNEGLEEMDVINKQYDPYNSEVIDMQEGEEDNMVVAVARKGYTYNGQLLRVAQVIVSKKVAK